MSEKEIVFNNLTVTYKGLFDIPETIGELHKALKERGYNLHEKKSEQLVQKDSMTFFYDLRTTKPKTNFVQIRMYIKFIVDNLIEKTIEVEGIPKKFQQGDLQIVFDTYMHTDFQNRWNQKPYISFLYIFINKFIYEYPMDPKFRGELTADTRYVYDHMRSHLKLYKYKTGSVKKEKAAVQLP